MNVADTAQTARVLLIAWAVFAPLWLLTVAAAAWGRAALSRREIAGTLALTIAASVLLALPAAWANYAYFAGFNPQPKLSQAETGGRFAVLLLPVYSAIVAWVAFHYAVQSAERRGAVRRAPALRIASNFAIAAAVLLGFVVLGTACLFAAGPKALG